MKVGPSLWKILATPLGCTSGDGGGGGGSGCAGVDGGCGGGGGRVLVSLPRTKPGGGRPLLPRRPLYRQSIAAR